MPSPSTTLLVSTYNWPEALELVLASVLLQQTLPDEVVIADDGSGPATGAMIEALRPRLEAIGVACAHVWHADEGFRLGEIRNRGIARARGDYILQIDGDCVLPPSFVADHLAYARQGAYVQGSRVMASAARTRRAFAERDPGIRLSDRGLRRRRNGLGLPLLRPLVPQTQHSQENTRGCNMAYWRADALRVNGYDTRMVGWGAEDAEFAARLMAAGVRRRRLKFGGSVFHLHHTSSARAPDPRNEALRLETLRTGRTWTETGIVAGPTPAPAAVPPAPIRDGARTAAERLAAQAVARPGEQAIARAVERVTLGLVRRVGHAGGRG